MINEEDIVFTRWTQVFILTVECEIKSTLVDQPTAAVLLAA